MHSMNEECIRHDVTYFSVTVEASDDLYQRLTWQLNTICIRRNTGRDNTCYWEYDTRCDNDCLLKEIL